MANLLALAERLEKIRKGIDASASKAATEAALTIIGDLAYKTPVDTSQAISNWRVTLDSKPTGKIAPHFPGKHGSTYKASAGEVLALAKALLKNKKPGQIIYITNNLPYIRRLNDGYSGQAPAGFVERAILLARKSAEKFKVTANV